MQHDSPPHSPTNERRMREDHHRRHLSSVSALTEGSADEGLFRARAESLETRSFHDEEEEEEDIATAIQTTSDRLKLADLNETGPLESEAETCILRAIEEKEVKRAERRATGSTILKHVSDEGVESLITANGKTEPKSQRPATSSARASARRRSSVTMPRNDGNLENELAQLTGAMQDLREDTGDTPVVAQRTLVGGLSQTDSLIGNAEMLYHRNLMRRKGTRQHRISASEEDVADPEIGQTEQHDGSFHRKSPLRRELHPRKARVKYTSLSRFWVKKWKSIRMYLIVAVLYIILPLLGVSALIFNYFGNPAMRNRETTLSYMLNFGVRNVVTFSLALATQLVLIDVITARSGFVVRVFGQIFTLVLLQSHGLPFVVFFWSLYSSVLTTGRNKFAKHWLYWQSKFPIYTAANPDGGITTEQNYYNVLNATVIFGIAVLVKRVLVGAWLGKRMYLRYGDQLADIMREMVLVSEVAQLALGIEAGLSEEELRARESSVSFSIPLPVDDMSGKQEEGDSVTLMNASSESHVEERQMLIVTDTTNSMAGSMRMTQRMRIRDLLGKWEEPKRERTEKTKVSIRAVLRFRQALKLLDVDYPFSTAFGLADTRESCIASSQKVYSRLVSNSPDRNTLDFQTIAVLGTKEAENVDNEKMKELIHLFRPNRDGKLSMLEFVKSIDSVYRTLRLFRASVENSSQIDHAFEHIINVCFYVLLFAILVAVMGFDPLSLILSISSLIVAFSFMIGQASARAFEGVLFVLLRRPFNIGDRIHVSPVDSDSSRDGSSTWFVEKVDLFTTTIRYAMTNEVATATNGSMANSRIINAARSKDPVVYVFMRFGVSVPYQKVKLFKATIEDFVKERPRQWTAMNGFRATKVEQDLGFIEYVIILQHRGSWQEVGPILNSKAEFSSFALEVSKKLDMRYNPPGINVNLTGGEKVVNADSRTKQDGGTSEAGTTDRVPPDMTEVAALFSKTKG